MQGIAETTPSTVVARQRLASVCSRLCDARVTMVACQRVIHPTLREMLWVRGIATMQRLGHKEMEKLLSLSGATPLRVDSTIAAPIIRSHLGSLAPPTVVHGLGRQPFVQLTLATSNDSRTDQQHQRAPPPPQQHRGGGSSDPPDGGGRGDGQQCQPAVTVVLVGRDAQAALELEAAAAAGVRALAALFACSVVCAGAGATEALLAAHLRRWAAARVPVPPRYNGRTRSSSSSSSSSNSSTISMLQELVYDEELPCTERTAQQCLEAFCNALESTFDSRLEHGASVAELLAASADAGGGDGDDPLDGYRHPWPCTCRCIGWNPLAQQTTCVLKCSLRSTLPIVDGFRAKCSALVAAVGAASVVVRTGTVIVL